ncbi:MAG: DNA polymerase III subunit delta [Clostridia bacterium]|nr:DNA polymerase III subunit delta [Clostridia bacterium]
MDITAVENSLKRKVLSPVYLFYGEESYLRDRLVEKFKATLLPPEVRDFNLDIVDGREIRFDALVNTASTLPFLAEKRLVIVQNAEFFKAKKKNTPARQEDDDSGSSQEESLIRYLENPSTDTCLIFLGDEGIDKRKRIYKLVEKAGQIVHFPLLKGQELTNWIKERVNSQGREISREALQYLVLAVGSNLQLLEKELEKLLTNLGEEAEISLSQVETMVSKQADITVFQLIDAVAEKRFPAAMEYVRDLLFQGQQPVLIISLLARQFRLIWLANLYLSQGYSESQVASNLQVKPYVVSKCSRQGRNFRQDDLRRAYRILLETDHNIKTGKQESVVALEMALIKLCS